jgi:hypothetical protein
VLLLALNYTNPQLHISSESHCSVSSHAILGEVFFLFAYTVDVTAFSCGRVEIDVVQQLAYPSEQSSAQGATAAGNKKKFCKKIEKINKGISLKTSVTN